MEKMRQVVLTAPKQFEVREVSVPEITETQVLIRVHAIGICGSDIHAYYGKHPFITCPIVLGHEATGEVVKTGKKVENIKKGDRVVYRPQKTCGECSLCREGRYNICKKLEVWGCQDTGASSDYYAVEKELVYKIPDHTEYGEGTIIEPLAVGVHAVKRGIGDVKGKKVWVIGAGTIGNMVAQSAKGLGAAAVMITDVSDYKLEMAKKCGIDYPVNIKNKNVEQEMRKQFGEDGADVVYECSANEKALNQALDIVRKGINIVIVGVYGNYAAVDLANVQDREYSLIGTLMYTEEDYLEAIALVRDKKVDLKALISKEFPLEQTAEAYQYIEEHKNDVQKVILNATE